MYLIQRPKTKPNKVGIPCIFYSRGNPELYSSVYKENFSLVKVP